MRVGYTDEEGLQKVGKKGQIGIICHDSVTRSRRGIGNSLKLNRLLSNVPFVGRMKRRIQVLFGSYSPR
jgi:hypothetical protein